MTPLFARLESHLFARHSDGSQPVRLGRRRIYILPTRAGLLYAATLVVMLIGAINYALALGHALVFLLAGLGFAGMLHGFRNLHGLCIAPGRAEPVFAGETAHFQLWFDNERRVPRLALECMAQPEHSVRCDIPPGERRALNIPVTAARRGWLELPRVRLATLYPLGLFVAWSYLRPEMRCLVYPAPWLTPLPPPDDEATGGQRQGEGGQEDFAGFRTRQPADPLRHVAWKASARQDDGQLLVKQFAGGADLQLWLDWSLTDARHLPEERLSQLAGWVITAENEGLTYGLRLPGVTLPVARGEVQRRRCLEALAVFRT